MRQPVHFRKRTALGDFLAGEINSLRPTQSMAGEAFNVSEGSTAACAPTNPIVVTASAP